MKPIVRFIGNARPVDIGGEAFVADLDTEKLVKKCIEVAIEWGDIEDGQYLISAATIFAASKRLRSVNNDH